MTAGPESIVLSLASGLRGTFLEDELILGESSGPVRFPTRTPPFTEGLDFLVREDLGHREKDKEVIDLLGGLGFQRSPDTPTLALAAEAGVRSGGLFLHRLNGPPRPPGPCGSWFTGTSGSCWDRRPASAGRRRCSVIESGRLLRDRACHDLARRRFQGQLQALLVMGGENVPSSRGNSGYPRPLQAPAGAPTHWPMDSGALLALKQRPSSATATRRSTRP